MDKDKEDALLALRSRPDNFRWTMTGQIISRDQLIKHVEAGDKLGEKIVVEVKARAMTAESYGDSYTIDKRYSCLVCGGQVLSTKPGNSAVQCCGQPMEKDIARPIPSSD